MGFKLEQSSVVDADASTPADPAGPFAHDGLLPVN
jgi:hypothetical protein